MCLSGLSNVRQYFAIRTVRALALGDGLPITSLLNVKVALGDYTNK